MTSETKKKSKGSGRTIADRIKKPSPSIGHVAVTIYGKGGVGKTTLLGSMPGKGLVLDIPTIEGGTMVLHEHANHIDIIPCTDWADFDDVYNYIKKNPDTYKWLAIDSITAAAKLAKRKAVSERDLASDPAQVTMQDWGKIGNLMEELFYRYRQLPVHLIFIAQEKPRETDMGIEYQPDISPAALGALIPSMFLVGRLFTREVDNEDDSEGAPAKVTERWLRVGPHGNSLTKSRTLPSRPLPAIIRRPDLRNILRWILGAKDAEPPEEVTAESLSFDLE